MPKSGLTNMGLEPRKILRPRCAMDMNVWSHVVILLSTISVLSGLQSDSCPSKCSCLGTLVDCSKQGLTEVPKDLPIWTEVLELQENLITTFSSYHFSHLKSLQQLDLSNNRIKFIVPGSLASLAHLSELKLNHNQLMEIPDLGPVVNLSSLNLAHNEILSLNGTWLSQAKGALKNLDLSHNKISEFSAGIFSNGSRLQILNLSNNRIHHLDKGCLYNLTALVDLKLGRNRIASLPKELFKRLSALKSLELNRNRLTKIEGLTFDGLTSLTVLRLRRNEINQLFDGAFFGLSSSLQLQLDFNNITIVTKAWLYGLNSLQQLGLSNNRISTIDKDAWEFCQQLTELDLTHNNLVSVDKSTLTKLPKLKQLLLDHNKISYVEEGAFAYLPSLQSLELNHNEISWTIEDTNGTFSGLNQVTKLGLAANRIKSVARKAFAGMQGLKVLDLKDNAIATIQEGAFSELPSLEELRLNSSSLLCDCQLKWMPAWMEASEELAATADLKCGHPENLVGLAVHQVSAQNFTCDDFPKPFITEEPVTKVALKEENVTLTCRAESTAASPMSAVWKKDNLVYKGSQVVTLARSPDGRTSYMTSELLLQNITDEDAGRYQCVVSNDFGSTYSARAKITVHVFPTFTKTPSDIRVKAGNTARLECHAEGSPPPEIAWKKDGGDDFPAARERRMHVMSNDDVFFIVNVKAADMGVYSCTAQNVAGVVVANATLTVLETPSFVKPMEDKETVTGETTVLECMASGSPKPRLNWTKDGGPLVATERHFFTADSQLLIIVHTKASDAGRYECEMSNPLGTERDSTMLTVIPLSHASGSGVLDDDSATIGIIIIAVVCCVVGTSIVWVIIIYQTRKKARNAPSSSSAIPSAQPALGTPSVPFPGVDFMATETEDPDINLDIDNVPTTILYPPDMEILAYKAGTNSTQQLYTYLADHHSDSEQSSSKDSGTGDSGRRSNSNEDIGAMCADRVVSHSQQSLNTAGASEVSGSEAASSTVSSGMPCIRTSHPRRNYSSGPYTRTLSTFVPIPQPRPNIQFSEVDDINRGRDPRSRVSLYDDRRTRNSRHSIGSPVTNYSLARHEV